MTRQDDVIDGRFCDGIIKTIFRNHKVPAVSDEMIVDNSKDEATIFVVLSLAGR